MWSNRLRDTIGTRCNSALCSSPIFVDMLLKGLTIEMTDRRHTPSPISPGASDAGGMGGGSHRPQYHHNGRVSSPGNYADYPDLTYSESKRLRTTETRSIHTDQHMANSLDEKDIPSVSNWRRKNVDYVDRRQQYEVKIPVLLLFVPIQI